MKNNNQKFKLYFCTQPVDYDLLIDAGDDNSPNFKFWNKIKSSKWNYHEFLEKIKNIKILININPKWTKDEIFTKIKCSIGLLFFKTRTYDYWRWCECTPEIIEIGKTEYNFADIRTDDSLKEQSFLEALYNNKIDIRMKIKDEFKSETESEDEDENKDIPLLD